MKKIFIWAVPVLIVIAIVLWFITTRNDSKSTVVTATVSRGNLVQSVEASGSVSSADELNLSFKTQGTIRAINVTIGDRVLRGQVLASIAEPALSAQVDRAHAVLESAQADLDELLAGATSQEISVSKKKVEKARVDLEAAHTAVTNSRSTQEQTREVYLDTALQDLNDAVFVTQYTLDTVYDGILDPAADQGFKTSETVSLNSADREYSTATGLLVTARSEITTASGTRTVSDILAALKAMQSALDSTLTLLDYGFEALSGAIVTTDYSQTTIDTLKSSFNTRATAIASEKTSVQTSVSNLTKGLQSLQTDLDTAVANEQKAQESLQLAQAELELLLAEPETYEIKQQRARILQAEADYHAALANLGDTVITAPVNGIITAVEAEEGEVASANEVIVKMMSESKLVIDVDIPESDITKITVNDPVSITLDAFGSDRLFNGTVTFIEPSERIIQDVVYYRVTVVFNETVEEVKPGMTADITITTAERTDVLMVPVRAVVIKADGSKIVRVVENNSPREQVVTTGIRGDDGTIEITSGLNEGDTIVTGEKNAR